MVESDDSVPVEDLREHPRYLIHPTISGSFGFIDVTIIDLAELGAQLEHVEPVKIGSQGRLNFARSATEKVSVGGRVVWSRLSKKPTAEGKLLYRTGLRFNQATEEAGAALSQLLRTGGAHADVESLRRKQDALQQRDRDRAARMNMRVIPTAAVQEQARADELLMIQQARTALSNNPVEALRWYNRAKFALGDTAPTGIHHREDVLAVWEYLQRSVPLETISNAINAPKK